MSVGPEDRALVGKFLEEGDESAFRELYRRHTPALYGLILRLMGGSEPEAQDLLQDTWVRASLGLRGFRWRSSLRTWLGGIAVNRVREAIRERSRGRQQYPAPTELPAPAAGERLDLERAIAKLPPGYRQVLVLRAIEGYSHKEIGALLGIDPGTSRSQWLRARETIRNLLAEGGMA